MGVLRTTLAGCKTAELGILGFAAIHDFIGDERCGSERKNTEIDHKGSARSVNRL